MSVGRVFLLSGLVLALLLVSCRQPGQETATGAPQVDATAVATPIVSFDLSPAVTPTQSGPPTLYLEPSVLSLAVGESDAVNVWIDGVQRLSEVSLELSFDPDYLQVSDADPEATGVQIAAGAFAERAEVTRNDVVVGEETRIAYQVTWAEGSEVDGGGILAAVTLTGLAKGGSPLLFGDVVARDADGETMNILPPSSGLITVMEAQEATPTASGPVVSPTIQPSPLPTETMAAVATAVPQPSPVPSPITGAGIYYVVQSGENLFRVGVRFGASAQAIAAASSIADPDQVQAGTMVLVPVSPPQGGYGYYVQRHDTVYSISRRFGMTVDELVALNGIGGDYRIGIGQILVVTP